MRTKTAISGDQAGSTLIELMVALFIVAIVMQGWWRIFNATSPYREAQRRAAVEIAAGLLDILPETTPVKPGGAPQDYAYNGLTAQFDAIAVSGQRSQFPHDWFPVESPVRYVLTVERVSGVGSDWRNWSSNALNNYWARVELFDGEDRASYPEPFKTFLQLIRVGN